VVSRHACYWRGNGPGRPGPAGRLRGIEGPGPVPGSGQRTLDQLAETCSYSWRELMDILGIAVDVPADNFDMETG
jgi:hypothetical protein